MSKDKWVEVGDPYINTYACSNCGLWFVITDGTPDENNYNFCPNCGTRLVYDLEEQFKLNGIEHKATEVAKMLGFSKRTILNWIRDGKLKAVKIGNEYRISHEEVERIKRGE